MAYTRWHSNPTQIFWICQAFTQGRTLTHKTTVRHVDSWRLAAVVNVLRDQFDWPIDSEYRGKDNIKHYWLRKCVDPRELKLPPSAKHLFEGDVA